MVIFEQKWLYSGKSGCSRAKVVVLRKKVVLLGQTGCIQSNDVVFGQKWLYSGKVVVFGQKWFYSKKEVVLRQ